MQTGSFVGAVDATGASFDVRPVVGGTWPLEKWHDAFEAMHSGAIAKAVLTP